jgi:hypothetical protein
MPSALLSVAVTCALAGSLAPTGPAVSRAPTVTHGASATVDGDHSQARTVTDCAVEFAAPLLSVTVKVTVRVPDEP